MPTKIIHPCNVTLSEGGRYTPVFIAIEYKDKRLRITGVVGPLKSGACRGGCGQIDMDFRKPKNTDDGFYPYQLQEWRRFMASIVYMDGWNYKTFRKLLNIWDKWHLNDMRSACEHQQELGWIYETHHGMFVEKPIKNPIIWVDEYAQDDDVQRTEMVWNEYKGHECPVCGYSIGSAWLFEEVPADVIDWLFNLPDTDKTPAWV